MKHFDYKKFLRYLDNSTERALTYLERRRQFMRRSTYDYYFYIAVMRGGR